MKKNDFNDILKSQGIEIGDGTVFYDPNSMCIDRSLPFLLSIGKNCKITRGFSVLVHDYSVSVLIGERHKVLETTGKVTIGDNVFIGVNATVLPKTSIGNNVIIGAGSVVKGVIPSNVVIAGNPAKIICSIDEYAKKIEHHFLENAFLFYLYFKKKHGREPAEREMGHFFPLWSNSSVDELKERGVNTMFNGVDKQALEIAVKTSIKVFDDYNSFLIEAASYEKTRC